MCVTLAHIYDKFSLHLAARTRGGRILEVQIKEVLLYL